MVHGPYGPFNISDGDLTITITDDEDGICPTDVTVPAPAPCSPTCTITPTIVVTCDDNGTSDPSDDTYTYTIDVPNHPASGASYSISGDDAQATLAYDVVHGPFGPFAITGGDLNITITDDDDPTCSDVATVSAPASCSPTCNLAPIIMAVCDDNGTTDPSDDTYTYTIDVPSTPASGVSFSITGDDVQATLAYDVLHGPFGPFPISGGDLSITITDDADASCTSTETVTAPAECSDCTLSGPTIDIICDDNGTSDSADDTYTFTILVDETTGTGVSYALSGDVTATGLSYGVVEGPYGPYPISGGDLTIDITDESDAACALTGQTVNAPSTCSPSCTLLQVSL